jgi:hypothetical protein
MKQIEFAVQIYQKKHSSTNHFLFLKQTFDHHFSPGVGRTLLRMRATVQVRGGLGALVTGG